MKKSMLAAAVMTIGLAISVGSANADTFTLANTNGGDGYVTAISGGFDLFGPNNGVGIAGTAATTTYLATAGTSKTLTYNWTYTTNDCCGSYYDPAGYEINGVQTQLSVDMTGALGTGDAIGIVTFSVLAGQTYGFYVYSRDSLEGRGDIAVTSGVSAVPLPAALPLFATGLGVLGLLGWRRKRKAVVAG
jgi:hypothetical protein